MSVTDQWKKLTTKREDRIFMWILSISLVFLGYMIGYWSSETKKSAPIIFQGPGAVPTILSDSDIAVLTDAVKPTPVSTTIGATVQNSASSLSTTSSNYVASLNGTKYYLTTCSEVKRIKEENQVFFKTEQEAIDAGYEPAACLTKK